MIRADLVLDSFGIVRSMTLRGHSGAGDRGSDPVCAAATILARTLVRCCQELALGAEVGAPEPGALVLEVHSCPLDERSRAAGASDFAVRGFRDLASEFPKNFSLTIEKIEE